MRVIPQGGPQQGGARGKVPRSPPLKHTTGRPNIFRKLTSAFLLIVFRLVKLQCKWTIKKRFTLS